MKQRQLGQSGELVPEIGLGCMALSSWYNKIAEDDAVAVIHRAADLGCHFLDTADVYAKGHNEELVGRAIKGRRQDFLVATKFGNVMDPTTDWPQGSDGSPAYVYKACEASLRRLGTDVIDLYYYHRIDRRVPIEETVGAMARLVEQGKVRHMGLSEASAETIRRADATAPIAAIQNEYSLWTRDPEGDILDACRERQISVVAFSVFGRGFLAGAVTDLARLTPDDRRREFPRFYPDNFRHNLTLLPPWLALARDYRCTPAQLALAWVVRQGDLMLPIPGTTSIAHLEENVAALDLALTPEDLTRIGAAFPYKDVAGTRYSDFHLNNVNV